MPNGRTSSQTVLEVARILQNRRGRKAHRFLNRTYTIRQLKDYIYDELFQLDEFNVMVRYLTSKSGERRLNKIKRVVICDHNGIVGHPEYPASREYNRSGSLRSLTWIHNGRFLTRSNDQPSKIVFNNHGDVIERRWSRFGELGRSRDLPSVEKYNKGGKVVEQKWHVLGKLHRVKGPAIIKHTEIAYEGVETRHEWYWRDLLHRLDGPAVITKDKQEFRFLGRQVSPSTLVKQGIDSRLMSDADATLVKLTWC